LAAGVHSIVMSEHNNNSCSAFTLWEILFLFIIVGIMAAIAIPNHVGSHTSPANTCINNLRQIDGAANQFALENHLTDGDRINFPDDPKPFLYRGGAAITLVCPLGGTYHLDKVGESPTCSLSNTVSPAHVFQ
jgi:type II secretory pathway pseudopilin PulG